MSQFINTDTEEIKKFDEVANIWWNLKGEMGTLHTINPLRTKFITDGLDLTGRKVLDVGCGGGRTVTKLADRAGKGKTYGIDNSEESVAWARKTNRQLIEMGRVEIQLNSVSEMPFTDEMFDLVTAVETHFWWPDIGAGMRESFRVLKPGGRMIIIAEMYNGGKHAKYVTTLTKMITMAFLTVDQHKAIFADAGFTDVQVYEELSRGWICATGAKQ